MRVAVNGRPSSENSYSCAWDVLNQLKHVVSHLQISTDFYSFLKSKEYDPKPNHAFADSQDLQKADLFLSIGGDGTFLESVALVADKKIPILGINTGRLGFLSGVGFEQAGEAIKKILNNEFIIEERSLVTVKTKSKSQLFDQFDIGLNEFTITKKDAATMILVKAYINGSFLNSYWADGLIISTPTGSTGYSLSSGGPLVTPDTQSFIITPISPHNLNVRPLVVPDTARIHLTVESRTPDVMASLDSRSRQVDAHEEFEVEKAGFKAQLVRFKAFDFFETIRQKLYWGRDLRN